MYILFECSECNKLVAYPESFADGRSCDCGGHLLARNKGNRRYLTKIYPDFISFRDRQKKPLIDQRCCKCQCHAWWKQGERMNLKITWAGGNARQLDGIEAERVNRQLNGGEHDFIEFNFEGWKTRVYKQHIVSVEWRGVKK